MKKIKKTKISKEDKILIKDTVNSLSVMSRKGTGDEEMESLVEPQREGANAASKHRVSEAVWKTLAIVMFGLLILFATDVIEFKKYNPIGKHSTSSSPMAKPETTHEIIAGVVKQKPPTPLTVPPTQIPTANPTIKATLPPTQIPTVKPTSPPTENPTAKATPPPTEKPPEVKKASETKSEPAPVANGGATSTGRRIYQTRGQPMSDVDRKAMEDKWGKWALEEDETDRPPDDYYAAYPNRDIPRSKFPANAWQIDKDWLSKFLPESIKLVDRAINAILEEYGQPKDGTSDLFHVEKHDAWFPTMEKHHCKDQSGCTTAKSFENLKRRLLHAVMTEDMFVFAMGGHSSSAGHGNHFTQSYTLQVQWILEGVFSRLGVRHQSRNFGLGGLGTTQSGMATKQIFGHDIDILMWDSGMTEKEAKARDMFFRQGILGAGKVPMIVAASPRNDVLALLNQHVDADVLMLGEQTVLTQTNTLEEVTKLPWAAQYVRCGGEISGICRDNEYAGVCWIERDDVKPPTNQKKVMGGRAKWHPGNRKHQIVGRAIAFFILEALKDALATWNDAPNYELSDDAWHVTSLYDNTRSKLEKLDPKIGNCKEYEAGFTKFMCNTALKGRAEFTPRAYPDHTSIRSIMPPSQADQINDPPEILYEGPDVFNKDLHPPAGAIDVLNIIEAGVPYIPILVPDYTHFYPKPKFEKPPSVSVGKGYHLNTYAGFCDGSVDSWCNKQANADCLLYGHNDGRNGIHMDSYCGWMVTNLPELKHGFIAVKMETWHPAKSNPKTSEWNSINNERRDLSEKYEGPYLRSSFGSNQSVDNLAEMEERQLKAKVPDYCPEFKFEFSIDGKVTSWNKDKFLENMGVIQRVVEILKVVEDPGITGGKEKEVEFAFRITGCKNEKMMHLTHIYWA